MATEANKKFGRKLKRLREAKNMTKSQLAIEIQTSISTITNYETGYTTPSYKNLKALSYILGSELIMDTEADDINLKLGQRFYTNKSIPFYEPDNISGLHTLDKSLADTIINLPDMTNTNATIFATRIPDDSMSKSFMIPGHYALFQYDPVPENNIIVLAYIKSEDKMVIRYYTCEDGIVILTDNSYYAEPVHKQYYSDDIKIIGSLVMRFLSGNH